MYNSHKGWYKMINPSKFICPLDEHMKSHKDGMLNYKSQLELNAIRYCDFNKHVIKYSLEPFAIKYVKPTDGKYHRYYVDLYIEFSTGERVIVEVKSKSETKQPKPPKKQTTKSINNFNRAKITFAINSAKWQAARKFASDNNMNFVIITEDELK